MRCLIVLVVGLAATATAGLAHGPYGAYAGDYRYHGPPAPLAHDGRVLDTPEVAHAKAAHLAAHAAETAKAVSSGGYDGDYAGNAGYYGHAYAAAHDDYVPAKAYHGPPAPLAHDGRVLDTPEVAHAKAAHFAAYADELAKTGPHHAAYGHPQW